MTQRQSKISIRTKVRKHCFLFCTVLQQAHLSIGGLPCFVDKRIFLIAALQEISGKERELVTDPDYAGGLERMAYSMDDFVRRVFMDSLTGS